MEPSKRNHTHGARRQRNKTLFAASCTVIGWASILFAHFNSSADAFAAGRGTELSQRAEFRIPSSRNFSTKLFALYRKDSSHFANSEHDEPASNARTTPRRSASAAMMKCLRSAPLSRPSSTRRFATRLNYSDGGDHEPQVRRQDRSLASDDDNLPDEAEAAKWWQSVFQPAPSPTHHVDEEQQVVDEYLEFLDKRYKRLHEDDKKTKKPGPASPKTFSALSWLAGGNDYKSDPISQQQEEDALYVLGVAELASERLLQKHQASLQYKRRVPVPKDGKERDEVVIDAVAKEDPTEEDDSVLAVTKDKASQARMAAMFVAFAQAGGSLLKGIGARRRALIAYQDKKAVAAVTLALKGLLSSPIKALQLCWNLGGGKKTIALTVSAFLTAFLVIRPVAEAVMSEATLSSAS